MSRLACAVAITLVAELLPSCFAGDAEFKPMPRLTWNNSVSAPIGLYRLTQVAHPALGDLVAVTPPPALTDMLAKRRYLPIGVSLLKHVAALPGARVCRRHEQITINGKPAVVARKTDSRGRDLPVWQGCRTLAANEIFLLNCAPDSLDGRYFGPLPVNGLIGRATPILTRARADAPLHWHGLDAASSSHAPSKGQSLCA